MKPVSICRRTALGLVALGLTLAAPIAGHAQARDGALLIAHRGGVVDDRRPENSLAALDEAIRQGYSHVEVDLRVTKDGRVVCLHDRSLLRTAGVDLNIDEVTLAELYGKVDPAAVPTLEAFAARAQGHVGLMPDVKEPPPELVAALKSGIRTALETHDLMRGALFIGSQAIIVDFAGPARIAWRRPFAEFQQALASGGRPARVYFAFNHAKDFDEAQVAGFRSLGVPVVVTVNLLHYLTGDAMAQGKADVDRALALGVDGLQIDADYEPFARARPVAAASPADGRRARR